MVTAMKVNQFFGPVEMNFMQVKDKIKLNDKKATKKKFLEMKVNLINALTLSNEILEKN
jgi:hypothetical protein